MTGRPAAAIGFGAGAVVVLLASAAAAAASFPGSNGQIALAYDPPPIGGSREIVAIDPDGQNLTPLTSTPVNEYDPGSMPGR